MSLLLSVDFERLKMKRIFSPKTCETCGGAFEKKAHESVNFWSRRKFCCIKCSGTLIEKGKPLPPAIYVGVVESAKDNHITRLNKLRSGEKALSWKGGISRAFVKTAALKRDNYTCQNCGYCEPEIMEVDHIKSRAAFPELDKVLANQVTLCPNCHRRKTNREIVESGHSPRKNYFKLIQSAEDTLNLCG